MPAARVMFTLPGFGNYPSAGRLGFGRITFKENFTEYTGDERVKTLLVGALCGVLLTRLLSLVFPLNFAGLSLHLSFPAMIIISVQVNELLAGRVAALGSKILLITGMAVGVILDETLWLIVRNPPLTADAPAQLAYWSTGSVLSSIGGLLLFTIGVLSARHRWSEREMMPSLNRTHLGIAGAILIGGLILFHVSQAAIRYDVSNEDRSLLILGYEIHHIVEGQYLLMVSLILNIFAGGRIWPFRISFYTGMIGILFVADEILYYQFAEVSDAGYFGWVTILSGGLMSILMLVQLSVRSGVLTKVENGDSNV